MKLKQKYAILILAVVIVIFISGCIRQEVTCNPPYIKVGSSCCLDQNNNSICDKDEKPITGKIVEKTTKQQETTSGSSKEIKRICNPNKLECNGNWIKKCSSDGSKWDNYYRYCEYGCENGKCKLPSCVDECSRGQTRCIEYKYYSCSNYDADPCVEWSNGEIIIGKCGVECKSDLDCGSGNWCRNYKCISFKTTAVISKVIDGDTVKLQTGETVRLLGINAPEKGQVYYKESASRLRELIEGKKVFLEKDVEDKDKYGRLLRYIFLNGENINVKLVREGLATVYIISPNVKYETELRESENEAKKSKINIWKTPEQEGENICDNRCIGISYFHYDAEGEDYKNLNDEYVIFKNSCPYSCNLTGWSVKDGSSREPFVFPTFILESGAIVTLYTGCGTNTDRSLYWCSSGHSCNAIWNNKGDILYLRNSKGELILSYPYSG